MRKEDKKQAMAMVNEGMMLAQALMERADDVNGREYKLAQAMFDAFYAMALLYQDLKINPELKW